MQGQTPLPRKGFSSQTQSFPDRKLPKSNLPCKERSSCIERFRDAVTTSICLGMALPCPPPPPRCQNGRRKCFFFQGQILANNVAVDETEVAAKNGRIYTLTGVLIPPSILPILPHRCNETKREMKLVKELRKVGKWEGRWGRSHWQHPVLSSENAKSTP